MKTERNILVAFILNLAFAVFEFFGGIYTGSVAIISDAVHDLGDAASIGVSYFLEKKSKKKPDESYTYGYARYSVLGGVFTTVVLTVGSVLVVAGAVERIINPVPISYNGMIGFAVVGVIVNVLAAIFTHGDGSINQRAVNLHMLEDALGWLVVLVGAVVMRFTDLSVIDPVMSIGVALFILVSSLRTLSESVGLFLEKTPRGVDIHEIAHHVGELAGVLGVHHIHVWSMDGTGAYATMHVVTDDAHCEIKQKIRAELAEHGICHVTLELEAAGEECAEKECEVRCAEHSAHGHHRHAHGH